jgi:hypothetical protein
MRALILTLVLLAVTPVVAAPLSYYLPEGAEYDPAIPTPEDVLGTEVGEWHVRHDQVVAYARAVAAASDRVTVEETGRTHEDRPVLLLTVTSAANQADIATIRDRHAALADPASGETGEGLPAVVWLVYSVHGNEPSGANSGLLMLYHLAAGTDPEVTSLLESTVVLIDPAVNPDGLSRFAQWANMHKGTVPVADPATREHREDWPSGRTNHYWFDLNRDWMLLTHPESRARIATYHAWKPNVLVDFHEMGTNATYFFQPGVPSRRNPITPEENVRLTERIAAYHAAEFDREGDLYYSEEQFDDFYYGKGSTYPDANGCIGILFEQASSRGHVQDSVNGLLTFPYTIRNQFRTGQSTLRAMADLGPELNDYLARFHRDALRAGGSDPVGAYVFGDASDPMRTYLLADILLRHGVRLHNLQQDFTEGDTRFLAGLAYAVPTDQPAYSLVRAFFEEPKAFTDSLFYDVSAWTFPHAFNMPFVARDAGIVGGEVETLLRPEEASAFTTGAYAYVLEWDDYYAPRAAYRLLDAGARVRVATEPFSATTPAGVIEFARGNLVIPTGIQPDDLALDGLLRRIAIEDGVRVHAVTGGLTPGGVDIGSPSMRPLTKPVPLLVVGHGVSSYEAGEIWHLLDHRMRIPLTQVDTDRLDGLDLKPYTHLVMVNGSYGRLDSTTVEKVKHWVRDGGTLIAQKGAVRWAVRQDLVDLEFVDDEDEEDDEEEKEPAVRRPYAEKSSDRGAKVTGGVILEARLDTTHPLGYGYTRDRLPVFRNSNLYLAHGDEVYDDVAVYTADPLLAGYIHPENLEKAAGSVSIAARRLGQGHVALFVDNMAFRGFWYGQNKTLLNALLFGDVAN